MAKVRLDDLLIEEGYFPNRDAVLRAVIAKEVRVDDIYVKSAAIKVNPDVDIFIKNAKKFVSRGGHKLQGALDYFDERIEGFRCIDVGSSTGGFTDCLLKAGALEVVCVDVNYGQLAWSVRTNPRVRVFERTNIRLADPANLGAPFDVVVCDLSFIGISQLAPIFASLCKEGSVFLGLIKPQFESKHEETERGVVVDEAVRQRVIEEVKCSLSHAGFRIDGVVTSPIKGPEGNIEYLVRAVFVGEK